LAVAAFEVKFISTTVRNPFELNNRAGVVDIQCSITKFHIDPFGFRAIE
jgi:hypothetical protein